jgi:octaheme c-type cytochrome (tetrathionate reductase family)
VNEPRTSNSRRGIVAAGITVIVIAAAAKVAFARVHPPDAPPPELPKPRAHFDHAPVISGSFEKPQDVTLACLSCHQNADRVMKSAHWLWLGDEVPVLGHSGTHRMGKKNLINNFCISSRGNERSCMKCHAGYGWLDANFDFAKRENVDCLVCHERTGNYVKGPGGIPTKESNLLAAARSVGTPQRDNCLTCHAYGGGGQAVKHGDIDSSLQHPPSDEDVHIGKYNFLCVDCHKAPDHQIRGRAFSVSVEDRDGVACAECHVKPSHRDERIDTHLATVACQTCHIPTYARKIPTKAWWDWSKAGDASRKENEHEYLKIKGEFRYEQDVVPEYRWFNMTVGRYLLGDKIDPSQVTVLNPPQGSISDRKAKIWPFKIHRATQPYDAKNLYLFPTVTGGKDGYWTNFDWDNAFRLGSKASNIAYSGSYAFAPTEMYWPITHMVTTKEKALGCTDCHGDGGRMDWKALGYAGDPIRTGGRK